MKKLQQGKKSFNRHRKSFNQRLKKLQPRTESVGARVAMATSGERPGGENAGAATSGDGEEDDAGAFASHRSTRTAMAGAGTSR